MDRHFVLLDLTRGLSMVTFREVIKTAWSGLDGRLITDLSEYEFNDVVHRIKEKIMENSRLTKILIEATNYSMSEPNATLGDCLIGRELNAQDIQSLFNLAHAEIEAQHYEDAPAPKTQAFLDDIIKLRDKYPQFF